MFDPDRLANPFVQRTRESCPSLLFGRQWSRAADNVRYAKAHMTL